MVLQEKYLLHFLTLQNKPWKEVIYIKDDSKLEGRVCGASFNDWCLGKVKETNCGFRIGAAENMAGFAGYIDDVSIIYYICLLWNRNE